MFVKITQDEIDFLCVLMANTIKKQRTSIEATKLKKYIKKLEFETINFKINGFNNDRYISVQTIKQIDECITKLNLKEKDFGK